MKFYQPRKDSSPWQFGFEGLLLMLAAFPYIFSVAGVSVGPTAHWRIVYATLASSAFITAAFFILRKPLLGKCFSGFAAILALITALPLMTQNPGIALFGAVVLILSLYNIKNLITDFRLFRLEDKGEAALQRTRWAALALIAISLSHYLLSGETAAVAEIALLIATMVAQLLAIFWSIYQTANFYKATCILLNAMTFLLLLSSYHNGSVWLGSFTAAFSLLLLLPRSSRQRDTSGNWWDLLLYHSARVTLITFFMLCLVGTILLFLPGAASENRVTLIDAAFTSVSAVCVTGLIVLDTPRDFSYFGQALILLLIQLGGLGIMTVTTVAFYALGHRLSLNHEKVLNRTYSANESTLSALLAKMVKFTVICEVTGALLLFYMFSQQGIPLFDAAWQGIFTSISAFCNAGFALQSASLIPFQKAPAILHTIAALIIFGGLAPAATLMIPAWAFGKRVPLAIRIVLVTTIILLLIGTLAFLIFEWNGALAGLSIADKIHNAWFQSATLRTAGFNSVPLGNILGPTFIFMICLMFIGGSPGGTAGGIKTMTLGVLMVTFWQSISGYDDIVIQERRIIYATVYKAVTIFVAGACSLLAVIIMLQMTQLVDTRNLIFEATSALATVGLSLGATAKLDSIGKIIIMLAMFIGRIGPLTLFTLLSRDRSANAANCLEANINLS